MTSIIRHFARFNLTLVGAAATTLALFYLMQRLILQDWTAPERKAPLVIGDISIPELVFEPVREEPLPEKIEPPELPPSLQATELAEGPVIDIVLAPPPVEDGIGKGFEMPAMADGMALALVKVPPNYPSVALEREIEGYVVLEFDVSETGQVLDPRVLYGEPERIFDRAALQAVERWRYKPRIVDGRPVKMYGIQQMMSFELAD